MKEIKKILIIDDEEDFRNSFADIIRDKFKVDTANNVDFNEKVRNNHYDLIVLDISMDGKDGDQVYSEIREIDKDCKIVALTHLRKSDKKRCEFENMNIPVYSKFDEMYIKNILGYINSFKKIYDFSALIVDDEKERQDIYVDMLKIVGIKKIEVCSTIKKAKNKIYEKKKMDAKYDIYLIDICFKRNGKFEARGCELIEFLKKKNFIQDSILIPLTTKDDAKNRLGEFKGEENIHPIFYSEVENFREKLESVLSKSQLGRLNEKEKKNIANRR